MLYHLLNDQTSDYSDKVVYKLNKKVALCNLNRFKEKLDVDSLGEEQYSFCVIQYILRVINCFLTNLYREAPKKKTTKKVPETFRTIPAYQNIIH